MRLKDSQHVFCLDVYKRQVCTYTEQYIEIHQNMKPFHGLISEELQVFLWPNNIAGHKNKTDMEHYWSRSPLICTLLFLETMPYRHYRKIKQNINFPKKHQI